MTAKPDAEAIVRLWERGEREHPIDRALTILTAFHDLPRGELARLDVGRRDALLFAGRARLFGAEIEGFAECPRCRCAIEVSMTAPEFGVEASRDGDGWACIAVEGQTVEVRLPTSIDLAAIAGCHDVEEARDRLRERCIRGPLANEESILAVAEREIAERAGAAAMTVDLECPACVHRWPLDFDIAAFLWEELRVRARRLLREVDALARRYGWSEREILALSDARRRHYLELVHE